MEFQQLTYFLTASQTQNFRKAAELCSIAQSALSRQIAALEQELGVELFERVNKRVTLTEAGRQFSIYARNSLEQLQLGQQVMAELKSGERGTISIGCVEALATTFLPGVFARFNRRYPNIQLQVSVRGADELMRMVERGSLDLGLIVDPATHPEMLVVRELFRQPLRLVVPPEHRLARQEADITLEQVAEQPLVVLREGYGLRRIMEQVFARRGVPLRPLVEIDSIEGLKEFVKQGVGMTILLPALLRPNQAGQELAVLPIAGLDEEFIFALVYPRFSTLSRPSLGFIDTINRTIQPNLRK